MNVKGVMKGENTLDDNKHTSDKQEIVALRCAYCEALYSQWRKLDFRGIMHVDMNQPISIPLEDVFVLPDVLTQPLAEGYETLKRAEDHIYRTETARNDKQIEEDQHTRTRKDQQRAEASSTSQRTDFHVALRQHKKLIILGDPGAGKTTLLRYLLLQVVGKNLGMTSTLQDSIGDTPFVPCYIPLTFYVEICRYPLKDLLPLDEFLPLYLQEIYLDEFTGFLLTQLKNKQVFFLFDGLDELADKMLRQMVVTELERFTELHKDNYFLVTSRIVGYKDAPLSSTSGYQHYTLADFTNEQIKRFADQWCFAYELWVKGAQDSPQVRRDAQTESEKLFAATQRNDGVKRLAINPLLLTILALIQRQGIKLPGRRVELFDLCVATLLDTWLTAKGYSEASRMSKNDLVKLLRPVAFWMHQQPDVNTITLKQLKQQVTQQLEERNVIHDNVSIPEQVAHFLDVVRGKTGILVEKGPDQFGFLHLTFEEYFAARELLVQRTRDTTIKQYLHISHWREVILLTAGIIGVLQSDEDGVTNLVQGAILKADSPYEQWLRRDLLFAGSCLADDVGVSMVCEDNVLEQMVYLFLTSPYASLRAACASVLAAWHGTRIAEKAEKLVVPLLERQIQLTDNVSATSDTFSRNSLFEKGILAYYQRLIQQRQVAQINIFHLQLIAILHHLQVDLRDEYTDALALLSDASWRIRQIAATSLAQLGAMQSAVLSDLLEALTDPHAEVRRATALAFEHSHPEIIEALLLALFDPVFGVRQAAATTLGRLGQGDSRVLGALLRSLHDPHDDVKRAAASALGLLASNEPQILETLIALLVKSVPGSSLWEAAAITLGGLGKSDTRVLDALLAALSDTQLDNSALQAAAIALGHLGRGDTLFQLIHTSSDPRVCSAAITALGYLDGHDQRIQTALLSALSDDDPSVRQNAANVISKLKVVEPNILRHLEDRVIEDADPYVRKAAATALGNLGQPSHELARTLTLLTEIALWQQTRQTPIYAPDKAGNEQSGASNQPSLEFFLFEEPDAKVREIAVTILGRTGDHYIINALLKVLSNDRDPFVRQAAITVLAAATIDDTGVLDSLFEELLAILADLDADLEIRKTATTALKQLCGKHARLKELLINTLSSVAIGDRIDQRIHKSTTTHAQEVYKEALLRNVALLGHIGSSQTKVIELLLTTLCSADSDIRRRTIVTLGKLDTNVEESERAIIQALSDPSQEVKDEAVRALAFLSRLHPYIREDMVAVLSTPDRPDKRAIIQAFAQSNNADPNVIKALCTLLDIPGIPSESAKPDTFDRQEAAKALGQIGRNNASAIDTLIRTLKDNDVSVREEAVTALGQIGLMSQDKTRIIHELIQNLEDPNPSVQLATVSALHHIGHATPELVKALLALNARNVLDIRIQRAVVSALAPIATYDSQVMDMLCVALFHAAPSIRREIAISFCQFSSSAIITALLTALSDPDPTVQREVVLALGNMTSDHETIRAALRAKFSQADPSVRSAIVIALGNIGDDESFNTTLSEALADPDAIVCREAAFVLVQHNKHRATAFDTLLRFLFDPNASIRQKAAAMLGKYGHNQPHVLRALLRALSDENQYVRKEVAAALAVLGVEHTDVSALIAEKLQRYAPIACQQFSSYDTGTIDATLFALQSTVSNG